MARPRSKKTISYLMAYSAIRVAVHVSLSSLRAICFVILKLLIFSSILENKANRVKIINNAIYGLQTIFFQSYFVANSIISQNYFEYTLYAFILIHNTTINLILFVLSQFRFDTNLLVFVSIIVLLYVTEIIYTIRNIMADRASNSFAIFKKIGANPKVNEAYKLRIIVRTISFIDLFLALLICGRFFFPPTQPYSKKDFTIILLFVLTLIQQIFIRTQWELEDVLQRKIAIAIAVMKWATALVDLILFSFSDSASFLASKTIKISLFIDILVISSSLIFFLYKDLMSYGSGLKNHFRLKTRSLDLSN